MGASDNSPRLCRGDDKASLPRNSRLPINRCNLPAVVLGSLTYQQYPSPLLLDGVAELHRDLFRRLVSAVPEARAEVFRDYLTVHFRLERPEEIGFTGHRKSRAKANYVRMIRGWSFDSDGREGAVLKGWVESRFGLLPRFHGQALRDFTGTAYLRYQEMRATGLYGTNALEGQLDLLYSYTQYEFRRAEAERQHVELFRGINRLDEHEMLDKSGRRQIVLFNNLVSFTSSRERAGEFGDYIVSTRVPLEKIFFCHTSIPGVLKAEEEYLVIGGIYDIRLQTV